MVTDEQYVLWRYSQSMCQMFHGYGRGLCLFLGMIVPGHNMIQKVNDTGNGKGAVSILSAPSCEHAHAYVLGSQCLYQFHCPRERHSFVHMFHLHIPCGPGNSAVDLENIRSAPVGSQPLHAGVYVELVTAGPVDGVVRNTYPFHLIQDDLGHPLIVDAGVKKGPVHVESHSFVSFAYPHHPPMTVFR